MAMQSSISKLANDLMKVLKLAEVGGANWVIYKI